MKNWTTTLFLLLLGCHFSVQAQSIEESLQPVSQTYALKNVNIVQSPGQMINLGTIVMKEGLITAVGKNASIPPDAQIIEADSMYIYAGFIDGLSHIGIPKPKEAEGGRRGRGTRPEFPPSNPPNDKAGIQPERQAKDLLDAKEKSIETWRSKGFTAAHVVPYGQMLPGSGAIILLGGSSTDAVLLKEDASLFAQLQGASRMYPATIIGVMAKFRELYRQAEQAKQHSANYANNPAGMKRPQYENMLQSFYPVLDKQKPVFYKAEKMLDAYRVMALQKDLGFPLVISDLQEGTDIVDEIKASRAAVLLSLDLPKDKKDKKADKKKPKGEQEDMPTKKPQTGKDKPEKEATKKDKSKDEKSKKEEEKETDPEKLALQERKKEAIKKANIQAATFAKNGIAYGFSTLGAKPKTVKSNIQIMIENGLTEDQALAALTTNPAQILGVSKLMGTVEKGKIANLVVTDKPYFDKKSNVRYVFVDGKMYEYEVKKKKPTDPNAVVKPAGKWDYVIDIPGRRTEGIMTIEDADGELSGSLYTPTNDSTQKMENIELDGNELTFTTSFNPGGQTITIEFSVVVDGDTLEGTASVGQFGSFEMEGSRDPQ